MTGREGPAGADSNPQYYFCSGLVKPRRVPGCPACPQLTCASYPLRAASVSLGTPREFLLRCNADHSVRYRFRLGGGALLVMGAGVQQGWMHSVPRRASAAGERISLTFRTIVAPELGGGGKGGSESGGGAGS